MKRLTLMRHADARWKDAGLSDLERPLARRGIAAAEAMARRLQELELVPDLLLASPARRAQQTAEILARELALPRVLCEESLYLAGAGELLKAVQATGPRVTHLLLVGHNPGVSELVRQLVPQAGSRTLGPGALCSIAFEAAHWSAVSAACVKDVQRAEPARGLFGLFG